MTTPAPALKAEPARQKPGPRYAGWPEPLDEQVGGKVTKHQSDYVDAYCASHGDITRGEALRLILVEHEQYAAKQPVDPAPHRRSGALATIDLIRDELSRIEAEL